MADLRSYFARRGALIYLGDMPNRRWSPRPMGASVQTRAARAPNMRALGRDGVVILALTQQSAMCSN
jgi:hypothetical protein